MESENRERLRSLVQRARRLSEDERHSYLEQACAGDTDLRKRVLEILAVSSTSDAADPLSAPTIVAGERVPTAPIGELPEEIGGYRIVGRLGAGGMGIVFEATSSEVGRRVALKVLRPDLIEGDVRVRFRLETEVLAGLDHQGIARLYEAGTLETSLGSQPWYAMELVDGADLIGWADERELEIEQRLELFLDLCEAVRGAHRKGVIHRDLKPANVLVNAEGQVKVLDFGLARLVDDHDGSHTVSGQVVGTLNYMSPEQARGATAEIDLRSDVYSLGCMLHELLTGTVPIDLKGVALAEGVRRISEECPPLAGRLDPRLRGDLEQIIACAIDKEPERRYESAAAMAEDLRRHLAHDTVRARPASAWYLFSRFARRHRVVVAAASLLVVVVLVATFLTLDYARQAEEQARRAAEESRRAELEARRAEEEAANRLVEFQRANRYVNFIIETFRGLSPTDGNRKELSLLEGMRLVQERFENELQDDPGTRARLHEFFAQMEKIFGEYERAGRHAAMALELLKQEDDLGVAWLRALETASWIAYRSGNLDLALRHVETLLDALNENDAEASRRAWALSTKAEILLQRNDFKAAEPLIREALAIRIAELGDSLDTASSYQVLAAAMIQMGRLDEADEASRAALRIRRGLEPEVPVLVAESLSLQSQISFHRDDFDGARKMLTEAYEIQKRALPDKSRPIAVSASNLGILELHAGNREAADRWLVEGVRRTRETLGDDHVSVAAALVQLADLRDGQQRWDESAELLREALSIFERNPEQRPDQRVRTRLRLAEILADSDLEASLRLGRGVIEELELVRNRTALFEFRARRCIGGAHYKLGRKKEALAVFQEGTQRFTGEDHASIRGRIGMQASAVRCLIDLGRAGEALPILEGVIEANESVPANIALSEESMQSMLAECREQLGTGAEGAGGR